MTTAPAKTRRKGDEESVTGPRITEIAERVGAALKSMGAFGRARARSQKEVAAAAECSTRDLQYATLNLNIRGIPVVSACDAPPGIFYAETYAELAHYEQQLHSRLVGNALRLKVVKAIVRCWKEHEAIEPNGQRRLAL